MKRSLLCYCLLAICYPLISSGKTTVADTSENAYDVHYVRFDIHLNDSNVYVWGNVTTGATVTTSSMTVYAFELDTAMTIDSAKINGVLQTVTTYGDTLRKIALSGSLSAGTAFTAQVYYHGTAPAGSGFFNAMTHALTSEGSNVIYTVSDPYVAKNWWPCKQSLDDKIDSADMYVTLPSGQVDGSNGMLVGVDSLSMPGFWQYHWQTHYPIDYYLISVACGPFAIDRHYLHFTGSADSMLIENFFPDTATFYPAYKSNFDTIPMIIDYFSSLFGRYPFWQEKYGVCYTTLPGGMEHQTMTTIGVPYTYIIAHELCHQWFGDHVTVGQWGDIWLSEGFATYAQQLFYEHFWGGDTAFNMRKEEYQNVCAVTNGSVFVTDTSGSSTIFSQRLVYDKGAAVVHMLRYLAPSDSEFFKVLQNYQQENSFGLGSTEKLKSIAESVYGFALDTFFNEWVYGQGYPRYTVSWNQVDTTVYVALQQTGSYTISVPFFHMPIQMRFHSATGDTMVKVRNDTTIQYYSLTWNRAMDSLVFDPNLWIPWRMWGTPKHDPSLGLAAASSSTIEVFPNPAEHYWVVTGLTNGCSLELVDISGRVLWQKRPVRTSTVNVPCGNVSPGSYLLRITGGGHQQQVLVSHQ
jgi:aminopeptidase N